MEKEKLNKILYDHEEWLKTDGKKGKCANLHGVDLREADLRGANLRGADLHGSDLNWADLHGANLRGANLGGADLSTADLHGSDLNWADLHGSDLNWADLHGSDLRDADLRGANLRGANLGGANLSGANLSGAIMPEGIYTAGGAGSEQRYTYYDAVNDRIICGCWDDNGGNHLDSFKKRIENIYGQDGKEPNPAHYKAYRAAIQYFEACREAYDL